MKVQFGSGSNQLPGWHNTDLPELDVTRIPLPFADNSVEMILAEHLVEHLTSGDAVRFLTDCRRILEPLGVIRVCCPVVGPWLTREHARDLALNHGHLLLLDEHIMRTLLWMAGFEHEAITRTGRSAIDGHARVIGIEKDDLETCRVEAVK